MHISDLSTEELENELEKRKQAQSTRPTLIPKEDRDLSSVESMCEDIVEQVVKGTYHEDNDDAQYMYEEVMCSMYGSDFFKWFNKNAY